MRDSILTFCVIERGGTFLPVVDAPLSAIRGEWSHAAGNNESLSALRTCLKRKREVVPWTCGSEIHC